MKKLFIIKYGINFDPKLSNLIKKGCSEESGILFLWTTSTRKTGACLVYWQETDVLVWKDKMDQAKENPRKIFGTNNLDTMYFYYEEVKGILNKEWTTLKGEINFFAQNTIFDAFGFEVVVDSKNINVPAEYIGMFIGKGGWKAKIFQKGLSLGIKKLEGFPNCVGVPEEYKNTHKKRYLLFKGKGCYVL